MPRSAPPAGEVAREPAVAALSNAGGRADNEDACVVVPGRRRALAVVADGAGGHAGGERASAAVVRGVTEAYTRFGAAPGDATLVEQLLRFAQRAVRAEIDQAPAELRDMRSTGVVIVATPTRAWVGHVGDSRAYLVRDGEARQLTRDDTLVQGLIDSGVLTADGARHHAHAHVLAQCFGEAKKLVYHVSEPIEAREGDVIVACSDGLTEVVGAADLPPLCKGKDPEAIAQRLIDRALASKTPDNVTVAVVLWRPRRPSTRPPPPPSNRAFRATLYATVLGALVIGGVVGWRKFGDRLLALRAPQPPAPTVLVARGVDASALVLEAGQAVAAGDASLAAQSPALEPDVAVAEDAAVAVVEPVASDAGAAVLAVAPSLDAEAPSAVGATTRDAGGARVAARSGGRNETPLNVAVLEDGGPAMGTVRLLDLPEGTLVFVDGVVQTVQAGGQVAIPARQRVLVRMHLDGYRDQVESFRVAPGQSARVRVALHPIEREPRPHPAPSHTAPHPSAGEAAPEPSGAQPSGDATSSPPHEEPREEPHAQRDQ